MDLLSRMETFVRVVDAGSFSVAGRQLRLSVAAVSRHVAALEEDLGVSLVARTTRRMTVTPSGRLYYERCMRVLREVDEARAVGRQGVDGPLRMSVPVSLAVLAGDVLVGDLLPHHAGLRLDLRVEDRLVDLALEHVDVAVRIGAEPPLSSDVVAVPLGAWRRIVVASPRYVRRHGEPRTPADLASHEVLSSGTGALTDVWTLVHGTEVARVRLSTRFCTNAGHLLRAMAVCDGGVALLPDWFVAADLQARRLRRLLRVWTSQETRMVALYRASLRKDARVRVVLEHLRRTFGSGVWPDAQPGRWKNEVTSSSTTTKAAPAAPRGGRATTRP